MKTKTRQFSTALFYALLITLTMMVWDLKADGQVTPGTVIKIYDGITPYTINQSLMNNIINDIFGNDPSEANWTYIPNGSSVSVAQVLCNNGTGNLMNYAFSATSSTPFTMGSIKWSKTGSLGPSSGTLGGQGLSYTGLGIGINYGPDGIPGTADDIIYTSGNANTPVNAVYLLGMAEFFNTQGLSVNAVLQKWSAVCPVTETETYTINGVSTSTTVTYVVPTTLQINPSNSTNVVISWPTSSQTLLLQENQNPGTTNWITLTNTPTIVGNENQITLTKTEKSMFFRLKYP